MTRTGRPSKVARWKRKQDERKKSKRLKLAFFWLIALFLLVLSPFAIRLRKTLGKSTIKDRSTITFVLMLDRPLIVSLKPSLEEVHIIDIPEDLMIEAAEDLGKYPAASLIELDRIKKRNGQLFKKSLTDFFAVPVDNFLVLPSKNVQIFDDESFVKFFRRRWIQKIFLLSIRKNGDFSILDLLRLRRSISTLALKQINYVALKKSLVLRKIKLPDESEVYELEKEMFDNLIDDNFWRFDLKEEELAVAVLNASNISGRAEMAARLFANIGLNIVVVDNDEISRRKNSCIVKDEEVLESKTIEFVSKYLDCEELVDSKREERADIVLILGKE